MARTEHPESEIFQRIVRGKAAPDEVREVVRHLLLGCQTCGRRAEEARRISFGGSSEAGYDAVLDSLQDRLSREGVEGFVQGSTARDLYAELLGHQAVEGLSQIHSTRRYASLALCELLLKKSAALSLDDPLRARQATGLAVAMAEQLDLDLYGAPVVPDTRAIAWAYLAETRRIQADLRSAEVSVQVAGHLLVRAAAEPREQADLITLQASLRAYAGRFEESLGLLNRAASLYRKLGDQHLLGRILLKKGTVLGNAGRLDMALRLIRRSMDLIDPPREPRLLVCATHNYIWFLNESDNRGQATACLDATRRLYERAGDRRHLGRLRWLEGKLATSLTDAEGALLEARDGLAREGLPYEAALAAMDLAVLYAHDKKGPAMRRQADQMLPLFRSGAMYRETLAALLSFQENGTADEPAKLIEELGSFMHRTWLEKNPQILVRRLGA